MFDNVLSQAYDEVFLSVWGTVRDPLELVFRECGSKILIYEKIPEGSFGGNTYVYFDEKTLEVIQIFAFQ